LKVPDIRFNRRIGQYAHQCYTLDGGEISPERYSAYLASVMPGPEDYARLHDLTKDGDWIEPRKVASQN
ncbi:MAG: hypothetical protein HY560_07940, partial [Gemmatimonadetes bacterium]|nr:hypothetical protein [Gemmatimonadota bacterium]